MSRRLNSLCTGHTLNTCIIENIMVIITQHYFLCSITCYIYFVKDVFKSVGTKTMTINNKMYYKHVIWTNVASINFHQLIELMK